MSYPHTAYTSCWWELLYFPRGQKKREKEEKRKKRKEKKEEKKEERKTREVIKHNKLLC